MSTRPSRLFTEKGPTLDLCIGACAILEPNGIADSGAKLAVHFFRDTLGDRHRSDTSRLGAPNHAVPSVPILKQELTELCGLPRAGLANNNDDYSPEANQRINYKLARPTKPWFSRMILSSSSRTANAGKYSLCSLSVRVLAKVLTPWELLRCVANLLSPL